MKILGQPTSQPGKHMKQSGGFKWAMHASEWTHKAFNSVNNSCPLYVSFLNRCPSVGINLERGRAYHFSSRREMSSLLAEMRWDDVFIKQPHFRLGWRVFLHAIPSKSDSCPMRKQITGYWTTFWDDFAIKVAGNPVTVNNKYESVLVHP